MRRSIATLVVLLIAGSAVPAAADIAIEDLVRDAGLEPGPVAMRDRPGWRTPSKVIVRKLPNLPADFSASVPGLEIVLVESETEAMKHAPTADAIVGYCDPALLDAAPDMGWVQIYSSGAERCLDTGPVRDGRVVLTNMQKMSSPVIAEHAIAMTLSLTRGLTQYAKNMPHGQWDRRPTTFEMSSLTGKTMLVAGLGGIGTEVARRAAALGMVVYGTRNSSRSGPQFVEYVGLADELTKLAADADVVVNALPLTPATTGLFDAAFFDAVKPGVVFINVARGASVVTDDLVAALEDGRVRAAGLDVTHPEPLPTEHALWQMQNVVITPHVAGTASQLERHIALMQENLRRFAAGDALLNVVDPDRGY